jgi:hypothetical protein
VDHEPAVRRGAFVAVFGLMALWELVAARRSPRAARGSRWLANIGMTRIATIVLRLTVTPDMHRVHHSVPPVETNSNFGFNLPWWDRLLGAYRDQPADGHEAMTIGLDKYQMPFRRSLWRLLAPPFTVARGGYPMSRDSGA